MKGDLNLVALCLSQEEKFRPGRSSISHLTAVAILAPLAPSEIRHSGQTASVSMVRNRRKWTQRESHGSGFEA